MTTTLITLGRLALPTLQDDFHEGVGEPLDVTGAGVALGQRRPRPFGLTIPLLAIPDGTGGDLTLAGNRMRRQLRSMLQNAQLRGEGLYLASTVDTEINGWVIPGNGRIAYADGNVLFGHYVLTLDEIYRIAVSWTHRPARRFVVADRRLTTTPRDTLEQIFAADFATLPGVALAALPPGATDLQGTAGPLVTSTIPSADGAHTLVVGAVDGDAVSFEQPESSRNLGHVVAYDRRGRPPGGPETYRNEIRNPRAAVDLRDALVVGSVTPTLARITTDGYQGSTCFQLTSPALVVADYSVLQNGPLIPAAYGQTIFMRCAIKLVSGAAATQIWFGVNVYDAGGTFVASQYVRVFGQTTNISTGVWTVMEGFVTQMPAGAQVSAVVLVNNSAGTAVVKVADMQMAIDPVGLPPYVSGELPGCAWDGTAHLSGSSGADGPVNLMPTPSPKVSVGGWAALATGTATAAIARSTTWSEQGVASFRFTGTQVAGQYSEVYSPPIAVYGGQEYVARIKVNVAVAAGPIILRLQWLGAAQAVLAESSQDDVSIPATPGIGEYIVVKPAPPTASFGQVLIIAAGTPGTVDVSFDGVLFAVNLPGLGPLPTRPLEQGTNDESHRVGGLTAFDAASNLATLNANTVRFVVFGSVSQAWPSQAQPINWQNWYGAPWMNAYAQRGIKVNVVFNGDLSWLAGGAGVSAYTAAQSTTFAAAIVAFCRQWPNVVSVEMGNESNYTGAWATGALYVTNCLAPTNTAVKASLPSMVVIAASTYPTLTSSGTAISTFDYLTSAYSAGLKTACDGLAAHPYPTSEGNSASTYGYSGNSLEFFALRYLDVMRQVKASNTDQAKPIYITEYGLSTMLSSGSLVPESTQAVATRILHGLYRRMPDVRSVLSYILAEPPNNAYGDLGLIGPHNNYSRRKPAFAAMTAEWASKPAAYLDGDGPGSVWSGTPRGSASVSVDDIQAAWGWEEVYGPDYPFTPGDVPVLSNGRCQVRYDSSNTPGFKVFVWTGSAWMEQCKVCIYRVGDTNGFVDTLRSATLRSYSQTGGVVTARLARAADPNSSEQVLVTLRAGWSAPRFEVYLSPKANGTQATGYLIPELAGVDTNVSALKVDASGVAAVISTAGPSVVLWPTTTTLGTAGFPGENHVTVLRQGQPFSLTAAAVQASTTAYVTNDASAYGAARSGLILAGAGYVSVHLGFPVQAVDQILEAETMALGATSTVIADGNASGGFVVKDTQAAETVATILRTPTTLVIGAKYRVMARVRVDAATTGSFRAAAGDSAGGGYGAVVTSTATALTWIDLGDIVAHTTSNLQVNGWHSVGTGSVYIDRVEAFKLEDRGPYDGGRDLGQSVLMDCRQTFVPVER